MGIPHNRLALPGGRASAGSNVRLGEREKPCTIGANIHAIKVDTMIDEAVARAIPALRPLLGRHVELR